MTSPRAPWHSAAPPQVAGPSRIDKDTLALLFKGLTVDEIAESRHRAHKTVEGTLMRLMRKTETRNARELIYESLALGWLTPPPRYVD